MGKDNLKGWNRPAGKATTILSSTGWAAYPHVAWLGTPSLVQAASLSHLPRRRPHRAADPPFPPW